MAHMKKILIVNNNMQIGGVQKALLALLHEISNEYQIDLYLFSTNGDCFQNIPENVNVIECRSLFRCFGISQSEARQSFPLFVFRSILAAITKIFNRYVAVGIASITQKKLKTEYDVAISYLHSADVHSFYGGCNEFVIRKVRASKKVSFLHGDYAQCGSNNKKNNKLYQKFDIIAACSAGCRKSFIDILPNLSEKCVVVPNCHNFNAIISDSRINTTLYSKQYYNIISIARLSKEKAIDRALHGIAYAKKQGINLMYHVIGDGILRKELIKLAEELEIENQVVFHGNQTNPYQYLPNADLLLITSYHEAAPLVIDEAYCLGIPILSTDTTSSYDMITERKIGWVCENSQKGINETLTYILSKKNILEDKKDELKTKKPNNADAIKAFKEIMG